MALGSFFLACLPVGWLDLGTSLLPRLLPFRPTNQTLIFLGFYGLCNVGAKSITLGGVQKAAKFLHLFGIPVFRASVVGPPPGAKDQATGSVSKCTGESEGTLRKTSMEPEKGLYFLLLSSLKRALFRFQVSFPEVNGKICWGHQWVEPTSSTSLLMEAGASSSGEEQLLGMPFYLKSCLHSISQAPFKNVEAGDHQPSGLWCSEAGIPHSPKPTSASRAPSRGTVDDRNPA